MKAQRLRVTFTRGDEMKYITHLDLMRFWERVLRRAEIPVFYSEGFSPHPQIALAAPLPVGVTSDAELMDVFLETVMLPRAFSERVTPQLTVAVQILRVEEAGLTLPSLQAEVRAAAYDVDIDAPLDAAVARAVEELLAAETFPWEHKRDEETKAYDLRALIHDITVEPGDGGLRLRMLLRADNTGSGRPEQVAAALGLPQPHRIHRTKLVLAGASAARDAWRKRGRFAG
ncbi:MAG: TIGR03936 family radical SAM-associated protein [Dehalococcoidia bacterium]